MEQQTQNQKENWKILFQNGNVTVYTNGYYDVKEKDCQISGNVNEYWDILSVQFNQLKGKLFNLIEACVTDEKQREALKGLIRGFCNEHFKNATSDVQGLMSRLRLIENGENLFPIPDNALEAKLAEPE